MREEQIEEDYLKCIERLCSDCNGKFKVFYYKCLDSTMNQALRILDDLSFDNVGVVISETQSAGRGRNGHVWESAPNSNLYLTLVKKLKKIPMNIPAFSLVVSLVMVQILEKLYDISIEKLKLKWPNDILFLDGRKLSGILLESKKMADYSVISLGIGLNIKEAPLEYAISLKDISCTEVAQEFLVGNLVISIEESWKKFLEEGFHEYKKMWLAKSFHIGKKIKVITASDSVEGYMAGLADDGALIISAADGVQKIFSGDVSIKKTE